MITDIELIQMKTESKGKKKQRSDEPNRNTSKMVDFIQLYQLC